MALTETAGERDSDSQRPSVPTTEHLDCQNCEKATDHRFTRNQYVVVLLAPLVGMTLVGVPVMVLFEWGWLILPLAANAAGAVGDLWMTLTLLGFPSRVSVEDHKSGQDFRSRD